MTIVQPEVKQRVGRGRFPSSAYPKSISSASFTLFISHYYLSVPILDSGILALFKYMNYFLIPFAFFASPFLHVSFRKPSIFLRC